METTLAENLEKKRAGLSMAYEAVMTGDAARMLAYGRNKNRRHEGQIALMQGMEIKDQQIEDEDEVIHVGDIITNQIMPGSSSSSATSETKSTPATNNPVQATATGLSTAGKVASAIAVGAGLLGLGATGPGLAAGAAAALTNAISVQVQGESVPQGGESTITTPVNP